MPTELELLTEIRDLLEVIAGPELEKRDAEFRSAVRAVARKSQKSAHAIVLMDGSRTQAAIAKAARIDKSQLSKLIKSLESRSIIGEDEKHPKLRRKLPPNFFDHAGKQS